MNHDQETLNHGAFDDITESSAYWVGMLITDGCISAPSNRRSPQVILALQHTDRDHVEAFRAFLNSSSTIGYRPPPKPGRNGQSRLAVTSTRLAKALEGFGVVPRKTHIAAVRILEINRHFWRGVIDGDGSVCFVKRHDRPILSLCGASLTLLEQWIAFVRGLCPANRAAPRSDGRGTYSVALSGKDAIIVLRHLYADCTVALSRKLEAAQSVMARATADPLWCRRKGQFPRKPHSAAAKEKMRLAKRGRKLPAETRARMSDAQRRRYARIRQAL